MQVVILRRYRELMHEPNAQKAWLDLIELRQRLYSEQFPNALILDKYDLIADHILLYGTQKNVPIAYVRSISLQACQSVKQALPIQSVVDEFRSTFDFSFRSFLNQAQVPVNMGYLCLDQRYRSELQGVKVIDLLVWLAMKATGYHFEKLGLCATMNAKFKQMPWLEKLGPLIQGLPTFLHPVIPEPHEMALVPSLQKEYWEERLASYGHLASNAKWLIPAESSTEKEAA